KVSALSEAVVQAEAVDLASGWDRLKGPEKRHMVETITDKIVVGKEEVAVNLLYFPGQGAVVKQRGHVAVDISANQHRPADARPKGRWINRGGLSGPVLARIDLHVEGAGVSAADLTLPPPAEGSEEVAARVSNARNIQRLRYDGRAIRTNAEAEGEMLNQ